MSPELDIQGASGGGTAIECVVGWWHLIANPDHLCIYHLLFVLINDHISLSIIQQRYYSMSARERIHVYYVKQQTSLP